MNSYSNHIIYCQALVRLIWEVLLKTHFWSSSATVPTIYLLDVTQDSRVSEASSQRCITFHWIQTQSIPLELNLQTCCRHFTSERVKQYRARLSLSRFKHTFSLCSLGCICVKSTLQESCVCVCIMRQSASQWVLFSCTSPLIFTASVWVFVHVNMWRSACTNCLFKSSVCVCVSHHRPKEM